MSRSIRSFFTTLLVIASVSAFSQVGIGIKVGTNYVIGSMKIQPDPKNPPTNPKGLGLSFGGYAEIPFSDMVGIRPDLMFSFRRLRTEVTENISYTNEPEIDQNGNPTNSGWTFTGTYEGKEETDQRLNYFLINVPLMLTPSNFRAMIGPSFGFLMGGTQNSDITEITKGSWRNGNQTQNVDNTAFETTKKKGSAAIRNFRKMEVSALVGVGYTLDAGLDFDLRYYRGIVTNYELSAGTERTRVWTNMVEFAIGWTFGGANAE